MSSNQPSYKVRKTNRVKNHKFYKKVKWMEFLTFKSKALIKIHLFYLVVLLLSCLLLIQLLLLNLTSTTTTAPFTTMTICTTITTLVTGTSLLQFFTFTLCKSINGFDLEKSISNATRIKIY